MMRFAMAISIAAAVVFPALSSAISTETSRALMTDISEVLTGRGATLRDGAARKGIVWQGCKVTVPDRSMEGFQTVYDFDLVDWSSLDYVEVMNRDEARVQGEAGVLSISMDLPDSIPPEQAEEGLKMLESMLALRGLKLGDNTVMPFNYKPHKHDEFEAAIERIKLSCPGVQ